MLFLPSALILHQKHILRNTRILNIDKRQHKEAAFNLRAMLLPLMRQLNNRAIMLQQLDNQKL